VDEREMLESNWLIYEVLNIEEAQDDNEGLLPHQ